MRLRRHLVMQPAGSWLWLQKVVTQRSCLTQWSHHSAMAKSLSYTSPHTHKRRTRYAKLCWSQKEVREKKFHPAKLWKELKLFNPCSRLIFLKRDTRLFLKLISMVNKSESYKEFNFSIMPSHAQPRLICEGCQRQRKDLLSWYLVMTQTNCVISAEYKDAYEALTTLLKHNKNVVVVCRAFLTSSKSSLTQSGIGVPQ